MDVANVVHTTKWVCLARLSYTMLTVTLCHSECCVLSELDFEATGGIVVYVTVCYFKGTKLL